MADVVNDRLLAVIDWHPTRINSLTASTPAAIRTPIHFPSDRECLGAHFTNGGQDRSFRGNLRMDQNSQDLTVLKLSENLRSEIAKNPILEILGDAEPMELIRMGTWRCRYYRNNRWVWRTDIRPLPGTGNTGGCRLRPPTNKECLLASSALLAAAIVLLILLKMVLMLLATLGMMAPAATATKPAIKAYR